MDGTDGQTDGVEQLTRPRKEEGHILNPLVSYSEFSAREGSMMLQVDFDAQ